MEESVPRLTDRARPLGPTSVIPETKGNLYHNRYHRWPAPTSAESAKAPHSERSRASTSARFISDKREVGSSSLPRPIL